MTGDDISIPLTSKPLSTSCAGRVILGICYSIRGECFFGPVGCVQHKVFGPLVPLPGGKLNALPHFNRLPNSSWQAWSRYIWQ